VVAADNDRLTAALSEQGLAHTPVGLGFRVDAMPVDIGRLSVERSIVLSDLRPVEGGLEDLFLELTSDTQRDDLAHVPTTTGVPA
jgi:ABC-2 type transport system ATP-binding protein